MKCDFCTGSEQAGVRLSSRSIIEGGKEGKRGLATPKIESEQNQIQPLGEFLPGALDLERAERFGLAFIKDMFDDAIDTAATRSKLEAGTQLIEIGRISGRDDFNIAVLGIAHPTAQLQFAGLAMNEPAK